MQYFHWYDSPSDNLWQKVAAEAPNLHDAGFTALWLPPAYKVTWPSCDGHATVVFHDKLWGGPPAIITRLSTTTAGCG